MRQFVEATRAVSFVGGDGQGGEAEPCDPDLASQRPLSLSVGFKT